MTTMMKTKKSWMKFVSYKCRRRYHRCLVLYLLKMSHCYWDLSKNLKKKNLWHRGTPRNFQQDESNVLDSFWVVASWAKEEHMLQSSKRRWTHPPLHPPNNFGKNIEKIKMNINFRLNAKYGRSKLKFIFRY